VMIASVIIALVIFAMDQIVDNLMHFIYSLKG
jgi:preprotein translocase subunit SecE